MSHVKISSKLQGLICTSFAYRGNTHFKSYWCCLTGGYGKKSAKFLYTTFTRKIFRSTNDLDVPGDLQTMYFMKNTGSGTWHVWFNLQGGCSYQLLWEIGLNLFGLGGSFSGFTRATTHACLQSLGTRCVLAHALSRLRRPLYPLHCYGYEIIDILS